MSLEQRISKLEERAPRRPHVSRTLVQYDGESNAELDARAVAVEAALQAEHEGADVIVIVHRIVDPPREGDRPC